MFAWRVIECGSAGGQPADWVQCTLEFPKTLGAGKCGQQDNIQLQTLYFGGEYYTSLSYIMKQHWLTDLPIAILLNVIVTPLNTYSQESSHF